MILKKGRQITFVFRPHETCRNVDVAGTFNKWQPGRDRLTRQKDGSFRKRIDLTPGEHRYKFLVDGKWVEDREAESLVPNPFGTHDSLIVVG